MPLFNQALPHAAAGVLAASTTLFAAHEPPVPTPMPTPPPDVAVAAPAADALSAFGLDLFRHLAAAEPEANLFLSPYSISIALTMAAEGARHETEAEMAKVLRFPTEPPNAGRSITQLHRAYNALGQRLDAAAGNTDPNTRDEIARLQKQLRDANALTEKLERQSKWNEVAAAHEKAEKIAAELNTLLASVDRFDLRTANALWVERTFDLVPSYIETIGQYYGTGGVTPLDIAGDTERSRQTINTWVEDRTEDRIKNLVPKGLLTPDTALVITNAVYFLGQWTTPFEKSRTKEEPFTLSGGQKVNVQMMNDPWRTVPYAAFTGMGEYFVTPREVPKEEASRPPVYPDADGFSMIELPYKGRMLSMVLIAPRSADGLPALERKLTAKSLAEWLGHLDSRGVITAVPRFKVEYSDELSESLQALGMKRAFVPPNEPEGAQFPGMSSSEDPMRQLFIGAVIHKGWIEVNEVGTEAAAATAVMMRVGSAMPPQEMIPFTPEFRADRPFLFLIRDTTTGAILFIGRVNNPAA